jgi:hypothetical protein
VTDPATSPATRWLSVRDALLVAAMAGILGVVLVLLMLSARDQPSAGVGNTASLDIPVVSPDQGCQNFVDYWTEQSRVGVDPAHLRTITNCRQQADGSWYVPTGFDDERLQPEEQLTAEERAETEELRETLLAQVADLQNAIPPGLSDQMEQIYSAEPRAVMGNIREGAAIGPTRTRYVRIANAMALDPTKRELADYIGWSMARQIDAYGRLRSNCVSNPDVAHLHRVCRGLEDTLSIRYAPWPWDLADPVHLETYLIQRARLDDPPPSQTEAEDSAMLPSPLAHG